MALAVLIVPASSLAEGRRASMVIDANTGDVLHAAAADAPRHPASLTKMMTLYMLFEEIERGRVGPRTKIKFSERAAATAPSKLGLAAGDEIEVGDAIKALIVKSANDVAVAVAEHIAGSEAAFARMMTEKARLIGMTSTTFRNASGLPNPEQVTTARDMLTLALRLQDDFPRHYPSFATVYFTYNGSTYRNHNSMLGAFPGMDGLKTGYIRMSGFNVVSSVKRGPRHVVAAVFGGATAASRNAEMRALLARTLPKASTVKTRKPALVYFARATPPVRAERRAAPVQAAAVQPVSQRASAQPASLELEPQIAIARVRPVLLGQPEAARSDASTPPQLIAAPEPARGLAPSTLQDQAENLARGEPPLARVAALPQASQEPQRPQAFAPPAPRPAAAPPAASSTGAYHVQVGAYGSAGEAEKALAAALQRAATLLGHAAPLTAPVQRGGHQLYRARFTGFDQQAAANACLELRRRQIDCFVARAE